MNNRRTIPRKSPVVNNSLSIVTAGEDITKVYKIYSIITHFEINSIPIASIYLKDGENGNLDFELSNGERFVPGKDIEISSRVNGDNTIIFKGIIIKHAIKIIENQPPVLHLECMHRAVKMTVGRKNKCFTDLRDSEVIEQLISYYNLTPHVESTNVLHRELVQYYCTDWDFLVSRAEANGKVVLCQDDKIIVSEPNFEDLTALGLNYGENILEFEAEMDARHQFDTVKCSAWNFSNQHVIEEESNSPDKNGLGNISEKELADVIGLPYLDYRHGGPLMDAELKTWASAQRMKSHLAKVVGKAKFRAVPSLKIGDLISLAGLGNRFNGKGYLTTVKHIQNESEFYTSVQFGKSPDWFYQVVDIQDKEASGLLPGIKGLQIGKVMKLEGDPEGEFRVLIRIPLIDSASHGVWARLATLDAGKNRGFVFRPEIGDEVIVGFVNDDPRHPVILGQLHSSANPTPLVAKDDNYEKGLVTFSNMKIHFNDAKKILTIETPAGNKVILNEDAGGIFLEDQNSNKINLDSSGIILESSGDIVLKAAGDIKIDGVNIKNRAQAEFKAEGNSGTEVSSSGITTLKGSLVKIN